MRLEQGDALPEQVDDATGDVGPGVGCALGDVDRGGKALGMGAELAATMVVAARKARPNSMSLMLGAKRRSPAMSREATCPSGPSSSPHRLNK